MESSGFPYAAEFQEASIYVSPISRQYSSKEGLNARPRTTYLDVELTSERVDCFVFQNFYTASLTVIQLGSKGGKDVTLLENHVLMPRADTETEAQSYHSLSSALFLPDSANGSKGVTLRFFLFQPSPMWCQYELRNMKAFFRAKTSLYPPSVANGSISDIIAGDMQLINDACKYQSNYAEFYSAQSFGYADFKKTSKRHRRRDAAKR